MSDTGKIGLIKQIGASQLQIAYHFVSVDKHLYQSRQSANRLDQLVANLRRATGSMLFREPMRVGQYLRQFFFDFC